jgi:hypothetical protein
MSMEIDGVTYYRTAEVCRIIGISRNTLFRWMKDGKFGDREYRDWRGWRLFTIDQLNGIKAETNRINTLERPVNSTSETR